jgi:hypothetical protein
MHLVTPPLTCANDFALRPDAVPVQNGEIDYFSGRVLKEIYEFALLELGGQELLDDATNMARSHVDAEHPWSGLEPEPAARVAAYSEVLVGPDRSGAG